MPVHPELATPLVLRADTAQELMTPNPVSIRDTATVAEAVALLTHKGFGAAPVIDEGGRPVGVVSNSDILLHANHKDDRTPVREIMTPIVFSITPDDPAAKVVEEMLALKVHHMFVVDSTGTLVGVIGTFDILRRLK